MHLQLLGPLGQPHRSSHPLVVLQPDLAAMGHRLLTFIVLAMDSAVLDTFLSCFLLPIGASEQWQPSRRVGFTLPPIAAYRIFAVLPCIEKSNQQL